jgi:acetyl esterase/lipase
VLPAVLCIHGGGFVIGSIDTDQGQILPLVDQLGAVVVGVEYRLAPEHPHPTPVEDCHAALQWMVANAAGLRIDPSRIALFGTSAGGGLAAAVALLARDRGTAAPVLQVLAYPMLDDRNDTPSSHDVPALGLWNLPINVEGWRHLLGDRLGTDDVSAYAAPARAEDIRGLCPAHVDVGELDILRDESISYASRLLQAGVATELHVVPGAYHACEQVAPESDIARRIVGYRMAALRRALRIEQ